MVRNDLWITKIVAIVENDHWNAPDFTSPDGERREREDVRTGKILVDFHTSSHTMVQKPACQRDIDKKSKNI